MATIPPVSEQPAIVEAELGVREYWYETFRRVLVIPDGEACFVFSVDLYQRPTGFGGDEAFVLEAPGVRLRYVKLQKNRLGAFRIKGVEPLVAEAVIVETPGRRELVNLRLRYCGLASYPDYSEVEEIYRKAVMLFEGRDPAQAPLVAPEPSSRVYEARGFAGRRRKRA